MAEAIKSNTEKISEIFRNQKCGIDSELFYLERESIGKNPGVIKNFNYT